MARSFETAFINELTVNKILGPGAPETLKTAGKTIYVDSSNKYPGSYPTLTGALAACTSGNGDIIYLVPGHAETLTATVTISKAGVSIIGCGNGDNRPTFTVNAAVNGFTITGINIWIHNIKMKPGASGTIAAKLFAVTGGTGLVRFTDCHFQATSLSTASYKMYHLGYVLGAKGKPVTFEGCLFENIDAGTILINTTVAHTCLLIRTGDVNVINCRFIDMGAHKKNRWRQCIMAGSTGTGEDLCNIMIKDCVFTCRGVAVTCRAAAVSPRLSIINCRGISTSSNTAVADIFLVTYANIVDTYAVGAVNKRAKMIPAVTEA